MSVALPEGFEGILLSEDKPFKLRLAIGFEGVILTYSDDTVFIDVINGLGRPVEGCEVEGEFNSETRTGVTNENGRVILELDAITTLNLKKENYFKSFSYNRSNDGLTPVVVFQPPMLE